MPPVLEIDSAFKFYDERLWVFGLTGTAKADRLIEIFDYARRRYGIQLFIIDSLMKCGIQGDNVRTIGDVFRNKRAQFYYALADRLYLTYRAVVHGEYADPDDMLSFDKEAIGEKMLEKLFAELTQIQRKFNNNGKLELMAKVEIKQKLGIPSPNLADALMMCMHCPESAAQSAFTWNRFYIEKDDPST